MKTLLLLTGSHPESGVAIPLYLCQDTTPLENEAQKLFSRHQIKDWQITPVSIIEPQETQPARIKVPGTVGPVMAPAAVDFREKSKHAFNLEENRER